MSRADILEEIRAERAKIAEQESNLRCLQEDFDELAGAFTEAQERIATLTAALLEAEGALDLVCLECRSASSGGACGCPTDESGDVPDGEHLTGCVDDILPTVEIAIAKVREALA